MSPRQCLLSQLRQASAGGISGYSYLRFAATVALDRERNCQPVSHRLQDLLDLHAAFQEALAARPLLHPLPSADSAVTACRQGFEAAAALGLEAAGLCRPLAARARELHGRWAENQARLEKLLGSSEGHWLQGLHRVDFVYHYLSQRHPYEPPPAPGPWEPPPLRPSPSLAKLPPLRSRAAMQKGAIPLSWDTLNQTLSQSDPTRRRQQWENYLQR